MTYKITRLSNNKEISIDDMALEIYRSNPKCRLVWCDIEGIAKIGRVYYILDECGSWEYIDLKKYKIERAR